jgi:peptidoglycan/LPS O-acetylase OafA/YrhL
MNERPAGAPSRAGVRAAARTRWPAHRRGSRRFSLQPDGLISKVLSHRWLSRPGRDLSYGIYLWHLPVFILLIPMVPSLAVRVPLTAALTVLMAYGSFRFVETPIRRWASRRLEPAVRPIRSPSGSWRWPGLPGTNVRRRRPCAQRTAPSLLAGRRRRLSDTRSRGWLPSRRGRKRSCAV